jgi:phage gpG-like protein
MIYNEAKILRQGLARFKAEAPKLIDTALVVALNHSVQSFRDQGFTDDGFKPWKQRKDRTDQYKRGKQRNASGGTVSLNLGRAILVGKGSGKLRRSLRKKRLTAFSGVLSSPLVYANVHNEGLRSGRGSGFKMPKRQFVGNSRNMIKKIENALAQKIDRIFK